MILIYSAIPETLTIFHIEHCNNIHYLDAFNVVACPFVYFVNLPLIFIRQFGLRGCDCTFRYYVNTEVYLTSVCNRHTNSNDQIGHYKDQH